MSDVGVVVRSTSPCVGVICVVGAATGDFVAFSGVDDVDRFPTSADGGNSGEGNGERSELHYEMIVRIDRLFKWSS